MARPFLANSVRLTAPLIRRVMATIFMLSLFTRQSGAGTLPPIQTVFIIMLENSDWSQIASNPSAPYINNSLLPVASYCLQYYNPPGNHPSEPNYLWLEAGTNFGITNDAAPIVNHQNTTNHLVALLNNTGVTWKSYQEDISGTIVPLMPINDYDPKHDPFVFFDDVTGTNDFSFPYGIAHIRPFSELAADLVNHNVAQYNFITPNLCDDMHNTCAPLNNPTLQGDSWLATVIPQITNSQAYQNNGAVFITWDESEDGDCPVGMIVLSSLAKGGGYACTNYYTHSSTLRTMQEIFGVTPLLGDSVNATDLSDLFVLPGASSSIRLNSCLLATDGAFQFNVSGATPGSTNIILCSTDLINWTRIGTNVALTGNFCFTNAPASYSSQCFYRVWQLR